MESSHTDETDAKCVIDPDNGVARLHSAAVPIVQQPVDIRPTTSTGSFTSVSSFRLSVSGSSGDTDIQYIKASELFPKKSIWVEDSNTTVPPPFPLLPGECVLYEGRTIEGSLHVSNYRLYHCRTVSSETPTSTPLPNSGIKDINVPLGLFDTIECKDIIYLNLSCKDARSFRLMFANGECCQDWVKRLVPYLNLPRKPEDVFALAFYAWARDTEENNEPAKTPPGSSVPWWQKAPCSQTYPLYGEELFRFEVARQGYDTNVTWRVSTVNAEFKLCSSYPSHILVPTSISDDKLESVASFRSSRRLPAVVWRYRRNGAVLARCSQPEVGWLGWRSQEDENLLLAILDACFYDSGRNTGRQRDLSPSCVENAKEEWANDGTPTESGSAAGTSAEECGSLKDLSEDSSCFTEEKKKMLIVDARSYTTALANRARGGGCEFPQYYPQCDIEFMNLANIHAVRKSFLLLRSLCLTAINGTATTDQSNWFTQLDSTRWLHHMGNLLRASSYTAVNIHTNGRPVLVHCSDGWDRTPQIVSLAELMIDPFYRTIQGFQILVQREWLEFGHKFADRCGLLGGCEDLNERCPVFLQFLDCVHQLMEQFPTAFQFNNAYLVKVVQHVYSNLFGTFLWNTVQERCVHRIYERSHSLWTFLMEKSNEFCNYLYEYTEEPIWPSYQVRDLHFWSSVYLADLGNTDCQSEGCHNNPQAPNPITNSNSPCSSGYATPQQAGLTDSMIDSLAGKHITVREVHNVMEDSTDTLVDVHQEGTPIEADLDNLESFPLLEPSPAKTKDIEIACPDKNKLGLPLFQHNLSDDKDKSIPNEVFTQEHDAEEEHIIEEEFSHVSPDCQTCQKNWDLLNRNQGLNSKIVPVPNKATFPTDANVQEERRRGCLNFDLDGLLPCVDRQQTRLRQILAQKDMELEALRRDLHQTRVALCRQVCQNCNSSKRKNCQEKGKLTGNISAPNSESPPASSAIDGQFGIASSPSSWENVDEKEIEEKARITSTTLWVPDHAAPICMKCSVPFWMGRRRHHCRNCGKVFCSECADHELPLPHQNLYQPVRVCNICYCFLTHSYLDEETNLDHGKMEQLALSAVNLKREKAVSLSNLNSALCSCKCCHIKRSPKFKPVAAASN